MRTHLGSPGGVGLGAWSVGTFQGSNSTIPGANFDGKVWLQKKKKRYFIVCKVPPPTRGTQ